MVAALAEPGTGRERVGRRRGNRKFADCAVRA